MVRPVRFDSHAQNCCAVSMFTEIAGKPACPNPRSIEMYGLLGRATASAPAGCSASAFSYTNASSSSQGTSVRPIHTRT